jgi:hypothetical protein
MCWWGDVFVSSLSCVHQAFSFHLCLCVFFFSLFFFHQVMRDVLELAPNRTSAEDYMRSDEFRTFAVFLGVGDYATQKLDIVGSVHLLAHELFMFLVKHACLCSESRCSGTAKLTSMRTLPRPCPQ